MVNPLFQFLWSFSIAMAIFFRALPGGSPNPPASTSCRRPSLGTPGGSNYCSCCSWAKKLWGLNVLKGLWLKMFFDGESTPWTLWENSLGFYDEDGEDSFCPRIDEVGEDGRFLRNGHWMPSWALELCASRPAKEMGLMIPVWKMAQLCVYIPINSWEHDFQNHHLVFSPLKPFPMVFPLSVHL